MFGWTCLHFLCAFGVTLPSPLLPAHMHSPAESNGPGLVWDCRLAPLVHPVGAGGPGLYARSAPVGRVARVPGPGRAGPRWPEVRT
eukprot:gene11939-biopygen10950